MSFLKALKAGSQQREKTKKTDPLVGAVNQVSSKKRGIAKFAGAQTTHTTGSWVASGQNINEIIDSSQPALNNRLAEICRDFWAVSVASNRYVDFLVSDGIKYHPVVKNPDGTLDHKTNEKIKSVLEPWAEKASTDGRQHFYEFMRTAVRQKFEKGESIVVKNYRDQGRGIPFSLALYDPSWLDGSLDTVEEFKLAGPGKNGTSVFMGVEYLNATGEPTRYHFTDPDGWGKTVKIPANLVIHDYEVRHAGQIRGVSQLACAVLLADGTKTFMNSTLNAAKLAAKWLALIETESPDQFQANAKDLNNEKIEYLQDAIIDYLRPGERVEFPKNPNPGESFDPFSKFLLRALAVVADVPYEVISGRYSELSYTALKAVRTDFASILRPKETQIVRNFGAPSVTSWMDAAVLNGNLSFPDYFTNPGKYQESLWMGPGMPDTEPQRTIKAYIDQMRLGLISPQHFMRDQNRNPLTELAETKLWSEAYKKATGVSWVDALGLVNTAIANNPAAIEKQEPKKLKVVKKAKNG